MTTSSDSGGLARAIVVNSGCANACTGSDGVKVARATAEVVTGERLSCSREEVLIASTGVIGVALDFQKLSRGISAGLDALRTDGGHDAALAIMTTDTAPKETAVLGTDIRGHISCRWDGQGRGHD